MKHKSFYWILPLLTIFAHGIDRQTYRSLCERPDLSYQKELICKKHKRNLEFQEAQTLSAPTPSSVKPPLPEIIPKSIESKTFKQERLEQKPKTRFKPYTPGAYRKTDDGESS